MEEAEQVVDKNAQPKKEKRQPEPAFRPVLRRAVAYCGSLGELARRSGNRLPKTTIRNLLTVTPHMQTAQAIVIEEATKGAFNRLEFFPELVDGGLRGKAPQKRKPAVDAAPKMDRPAK